MDGPVQVFVAACLATGSVGEAGRHARQWLQEVGAGPRPYALCIAVADQVRHTPDAFHPDARTSVLFHCLSTILHALEREWAALGAEEIAWLRSQIESLTLEEWISAPVLNQAVYTLAVIRKRSWSVGDEPELARDLLSDLQRFLGDASKQRVGLALAQSLVSEFSWQHGSALNLTWESHVICHRSFERNVLRPLFEAVLHWLRSQPMGPLTGRALNVLVSALSWTFEENLGSDKLALRYMRPEPATASEIGPVILRPGPAWRPTLLQYDLVPLLTNVAAALRPHSEPEFRSAWRLALQAITQLASLQGAVFPANDDEQCRLQFVGGLCQSALQILTQVTASATVDAESMLSASVFVQRLIACHDLKRIARIGASTALLDALGHLTLALMSTGMSASVAETWMAESFDLILDVWTNCVTQAAEAGIDLRPYAQPIFQRYLRSRLERASASVYDADDDDEQFYDGEARLAFNDEQLMCVALLGRTACETVLAALDETLRTLIAAPPSNSRHECVCIVVTLLCNVLADPYVSGEVAMIPTPILRCAPLDIVQRAIATFLSLVHVTVQQVQSEAGRAALSPFAVQTLIATLQTFAHTYLTFDADSYAKLQVHVPDGLREFTEGLVPGVLDLALQLIHAVAFAWNSEPDAGRLCARLLQQFATCRRLRDRLHLCPHWHTLATALHACLAASPPTPLSSPVLVPLVHGVASASLLNANLHAYWSAFPEQVARLCSPSVATLPHAVDVAVDILNGLAKCSGRVGVERTFPVIMSAMPVVLARAGNAADVLELCVALALAHLPVLARDESDAFFRCCLEAIGRFAAGGIAAMGGADRDLLEDGAEDVGNLLTLLHHCTAKDLFDFGPDSVTSGCDAAYAGLCALLPLFSPSALVQFPDICTSLYELLSSLVITSPDKVVEMNDESQRALIAAIEFSLHGSVQPRVVIAGLNALKSIADYAARSPTERQALPPALAQSVTAFQRQVLNLLLFEPISDAVLEPLADCLLPLIRAGPADFTALASALVRDVGGDVGERLADAFRTLLAALDPHGTGRRGRFYFRQTACQFVKQCRPFLHTK